MKKEKREKALKEVAQAIEELTTVKGWLKTSFKTADEIYNWLGTACMAANAAKNIVYEDTSYKIEIDEINKMKAIEKAEEDRYRHPDWTLPNDPDLVIALDTEWATIRKEYPKLVKADVNKIVNRIYGVSFSDSGIRQALFTRMSDYYGVPYNEIYNTWLYEGD